MAMVVCVSWLNGGEFTIASYNCGGLSDHYDYIRAAAMQKLMQERYNAEPEWMARVEKVQQVALKVLFGKSNEEQRAAQQAWDEGNCQQFLNFITMFPNKENSPNTSWHKLCGEMLSTYHVRPVELRDQEVHRMLLGHLQDLNKLNDGVADYKALLTAGRGIMAERIFLHQLKYDIICLQEANYLKSDMFPAKYQVALADHNHSINGLAWNSERFALADLIGSINGDGFAAKLLDKETGQTVLVVSGHLSGCNPFEEIISPETKISDAAKGNKELTNIFQLFETLDADVKVIGMDSNVTPMHPRMKIIKKFGYQLDAENFLEPTCTNPYQILNTRIDWVAAKSNGEVSVTNIPVLGVGLNSIQTNLSDHKPIAARIKF